MKDTFHRILFVDDDADEQALFTHVLKNSITSAYSLHVASSGNQAISFLCGEHPFDNRRDFPFPSIVITDLRMPDGSGFDILEFLQHNPAWSVIPRVVLSSSDDPSDITTAYLLGASSFHRKPTLSSEFVELMRSLFQYWERTAFPPVDLNGRLMMSEPVAHWLRTHTQTVAPLADARMSRYPSAHTWLK